MYSLSSFCNKCLNTVLPKEKSSFQIAVLILHLLLPACNISLTKNAFDKTVHLSSYDNVYQLQKTFITVPLLSVSVIFHEEISPQVSSNLY